MRRALVWFLIVLLTVGGALGVTVYVGAFAVASDRVLFTEEYGAVFAFSAVALIAGGVSIAALLHRLPRRVTFPNEWLCIFVFLSSLAAGIAIMVADRFHEATPVLALIASLALFGFFTRVLTRWTPEKPVDTRTYVMSSIWGMIGAPSTAIVLQLATVMMLVAGGAAGLYMVDETLIDNIEAWINQVSESADLGVLETPTITFAALGILGVTAPLSEELTKFLGVYILLRKRVATRYGLFLAGAASGLGFAVVETLGYALMSGEAWPQIMLLRSPVALIHVAATSIVALGWFKQRQRGGHALVLYFVLAVVLHAAWNSLFVSMMVVAAGIDTSDAVDPAAGLLVLVIVGAMGAVLVGSVLWIIGNARRLGKEAASVPASEDVWQNYTPSPAYPQIG